MTKKWRVYLVEPGGHDLLVSNRLNGIVGSEASEYSSSIPNCRLHSSHSDIMRAEVFEWEKSWIPLLLWSSHRISGFDASLKQEAEVDKHVLVDKTEVKFPALSDFLTTWDKCKLQRVPVEGFPPKVFLFWDWSSQLFFKKKAVLFLCTFYRRFGQIYRIRKTWWWNIWSASYFQQKKIRISLT